MIEGQTIIKQQLRLTHHTGNGFTLVDVHALPGVHVLEKSGLAGQVVGTLLARVAPGLADGGAAELLGAHHSFKLSRALAVLDASVSRRQSRLSE